MFFFVNILVFRVATFVKLVMTCLEYETVDLRTVFDLTSLIIHDASFLYLIGTVRCATGMT